MLSTQIIGANALISMKKLYFSVGVYFLTDLAVLQNATEVSCLQVRASGGSAFERRYAARIVPLFPGTGGRWAAYGNSAANCSAAKLFSGRAA